MTKQRTEWKIKQTEDLKCTRKYYGQLNPRTVLQCGGGENLSTSQLHAAHVCMPRFMLSE